MLVELAVGDAYGAGFEYAPADLVRRANTLRAYVRHPRHRDLRPGMYTDDTQMTLAVAEWLLAGDLTRDAFAEHVVAAYHRDPRAGYARGFRGVLETVRSGPELVAALRPDSDRSGAAMRAAPLGLLADRAEVVRLTRLQARLTHDTPGGTAAAVAAALAVHYLRHDLGPVRELATWLQRTSPAPAGVAPWDRPWRGRVGAAGADSVRAAVTSLVSGTSLSGLLRTCVAWTGDVDTVATIALAAASCSREYTADLPAVLLEGLEDGAFGRRYLADLDARLAARTAGAA